MEKSKKVIFVINQYMFKKILAENKIPSSAKLILFNLIHRLGGKNYCFPSQETIGQDLGLTSRQVRNMLTVLKNRGFIKWQRGAFNPKTQNKTSSNLYDLSELLIRKEI